MKIWVWLIVTLLVQELVSTNAVLLFAYQEHYNVWFIHLIFILATTFDIWLGYFMGKWLQKKFQHSKFIAYSRAKAEKFERTLGGTSIGFILVALGLINLNYVNSFLSSWLELPFGKIFFYLFVGDLIWYVLEWSIILGVSAFISPYYAMYIVVSISLLLSFVIALANRKFLKRK